MVRKVSRGVSDTPFLVYGLILVVAWIAYNKFFRQTGFSAYSISGALKSDQSNYDQIAERLFGAMRGIGTDEKTVFEILDGLTGNELKAVYNAFGTRNYSLFGNDGFLSRWSVTGFDLDLFGWFKKELGKADLEEMRALWKRKKVDISF